jgi:rhamnose utilization protein RhaD (predicted bifunctional aldolase and dehydrogenase)
MDLVALSHEIANPLEECVILGEGNTSQRLSDDDFLIKASGRSLVGIDASGFCQVRFAPILQSLKTSVLDDAATADLLRQSVSDGSAAMPSTETFMHAYLLSLPGVSFVAHTHPVPLVSLLCLDVCESIKDQRLFPDEIVCCGPAACIVPYAGPGQELARSIREQVEDYSQRLGALPKTIWIRNHGLICIGQTTHEVLSATRMSVKAARIWLGALQTGLPIRSLTPAQIERIHSRPDEHHRQRLLWRLSET